MRARYEYANEPTMRRDARLECTRVTRWLPLPYSINTAQTRSRPRAGADAARHGNPRQCFGGGAHALTIAQQHARSAGVRRQQAGGGAMNKKVQSEM